MDWPWLLPQCRRHDNTLPFVHLIMLAATKKKKGTVKGGSLFAHPIQQLSRGDVLWDDDYVEAMAEGKKPAEPINWDKILKPVDEEIIKKDEVVRTYSEAIEKAMCPKYEYHPFKVFDDTTWYSDGEDVKHYNIKCLGTDSSPCSTCSNKKNVTKFDAGVYTPSPSPEKPPAKKPRQETSVFAQAAGFNKNDFEGEEESPQKISADACKWCQLEPCIIDDDESREEGKMIVDNLNSQQGTVMKNFRFALYRMHARQLGYVGERCILPRCVYLYVEKHFVEPGEKRAGFKPKPQNK